MRGGELMKLEGGELVVGTKALEFVVDVWDSGLDMDEFEMQDRLEELGLLVREKFNPAKHRGAGSEYVEPGEPWYMINPGIKVVLEESQPKSREVERSMASASRP
jgi:hypothetical protein